MQLSRYEFMIGSCLCLLVVFGFELNISSLCDQILVWFDISSFVFLSLLEGNGFMIRDLLIVFDVVDSIVCFKVVLFFHL